MKRYTQEMFDALPVVDGVRQCPTGDYTAIVEFGRSHIGEESHIGAGSSIGAWSHIGEGSHIGAGSTFHYWPVSVLRCWLGELSDNLTNELMHRDAESHPSPKMSREWAKGGPCPYSLPVERMHHFEERKEAWVSGRWRRMKDRDLIRAIAKEKRWKLCDTDNGGE